MGFVAPRPLDAWDQFCYFSAYFDEAFCDRVVALARERPAEEARIATGEDRTAPDEMRRSRIRWLALDEASRFVYDRVAELMLAANAARWHFEIAGFGAPIQYTEYDGSGARYDWHTDIGAGRFSTRKLSCTIQLSAHDAYTGGAFEVFRREPMDELQAALRVRGTAIVFPAYVPHRVTPVVAGCRSSLVAWLDGPPYR